MTPHDGSMLPVPWQFTKPAEGLTSALVAGASSCHIRSWTGAGSTVGHIKAGDRAGYPCGTRDSTRPRGPLEDRLAFGYPARSSPWRTTPAEMCAQANPSLRRRTSTYLQLPTDDEKQRYLARVSRAAQVLKVRLALVGAALAFIVTPVLPFVAFALLASDPGPRETPPYGPGPWYAVALVASFLVPAVGIVLMIWRERVLRKSGWLGGPARSSS